MAKEKTLKNKQIEIIPAILVHTKSELKEKIKRVENLVQTVQIDIEDGFFVPIKTIQAAQFRRIKIKPKLEIHLMVRNPIKYITDYGKIGAHRIIFHYESCKDDKEAKRLINIIKSKRIKAGISISPKTSASKIKKFLDDVDFVQVLAIHAGYAGQRFLPKQLQKVRQIRKWKKNLPIEVDGGVHIGTAKQCVKAGATRLAVGTYLWSAENIKKAISELRKDATI
ncbi:ribulose-phosphate 3-epimerase [Candidatus Woesearchaeota archaeon]|nr:ribulose-phosphate 3-epimerase [Candidatus Woesearchaeota archaeon]